MNSQINQTPGEPSDQAGSAFVIVIMLTGILMIAGASLTYLTGNAGFKARKLLNGVRALAVAEAGVSDMISKMSTNYTYWANNRSNSASFGGGTFSVTTKYNTNNAHVLISSTGIVDNDRRTTVLELLGNRYDLYDSTLGIDGAIVAGGNVTLDTGALTINGRVHANGSILREASATPKVNGNITACGTIAFSPEAGYSASAGVMPIEIPTFLPFDQWKTLAINGGIYYSNSVSFGGIDLLPSNGVVYVEGDVLVCNRSSLKGTLVATGTIEINNRFEQTSFNTNWPCMLAGWDLIEVNQNDYYGVMFAGHDVRVDNRRNIRGSIIALNNVKMENGTTLTPLTFNPAWTPMDTNQQPPSIIYGGWLQ